MKCAKIGPVDKGARCYMVKVIFPEGNSFEYMAAANDSDQALDMAREKYPGAGCYEYTKNNCIPRNEVRS